MWSLGLCNCPKKYPTPRNTSGARSNKERNHVHHRPHQGSDLHRGLGVAGLLVAGCAGGGYLGDGGADLGGNATWDGTGNGDDPGVENPVDEVGTTLTGIVRDSWGQPVPGARVTTDTGLSGVTDEGGRFLFEDVEAGDVLVDFYKDGWAHSQQPFTVFVDVENSMLQTLAELDLIETFSSADGLTFDLDGAAVELPGDNFVDANGNPYEGDVTVEAVWFDLASPMDQGNELLATPGDFSALRTDGEGVTLESFGMLQVNLLAQDGSELNLGEQAAPMQFSITDLGSLDAPVVGEVVPAWSYDTETGKWVEEGQGTVVRADDGSLVWEFEAPHFSTWNVDKPLPTHGCVTGQLLDPWGDAWAGATVRFIGQTYISTTTARTAGDGSFCVEVKNGETGFIEFAYSVNGQWATQRTDPVTIPSGPGTCTDGNFSDCVDIGTINMEIVTCVSGVVVDSGNVGIAGATVVSPQGGQAITDANGGFCLTVPVFQSTQVYVIPDPQDPTAFQPANIWTNPGNPACQGGCSNLVIIKPITNTSCAEGLVNFNGQAVPQFPVEAYLPGFPAAPIATTLSGADGSYCINVPGDQEVEVRIGDAQYTCGSQMVSAWADGAINGATCDWAGMDECAWLAPFNCTAMN